MVSRLRWTRSQVGTGSRSPARQPRWTRCTARSQQSGSRRRGSSSPAPCAGWKDEKGYGRITGDDGYIYFCHFSALQMEGYKTLRAGQRVEFERIESMADHGRAGAANVRVIDEA